MITYPLHIAILVEGIGLLVLGLPQVVPNIFVFSLQTGQTCRNIEHCAIKPFGGKKKVPKEYMVYYRGEDEDTKPNF